MTFEGPHLSFATFHWQVTHIKTIKQEDELVEIQSDTGTWYRRWMVRFLNLSQQVSCPGWGLGGGFVGCLGFGSLGGSRAGQPNQLGEAAIRLWPPQKAFRTATSQRTRRRSRPSPSRPLLHPRPRSFKRVPSPSTGLGKFSPLLCSRVSSGHLDDDGRLVHHVLQVSHAGGESGDLVLDP